MSRRREDMENVGEMAAALEALAAWMQDKLAGGSPPKWVAQQGIAGMAYIASEAREATHPDRAA